MTPLCTASPRRAVALAAGVASAVALAACGGTGGSFAAPAADTSASASSMPGMKMGGKAGSMPGMDMGGKAGSMPASGGPRQLMPDMRKLGSVVRDGMRISAVVMRPSKFTAYEGGRFVLHRPMPRDNAHLMVVLADPQTGETIPYATVSARIVGPRGKPVYDGTLWPMISRTMGMHYGDLMAFPHPGTYRATLVVGVPKVGRHPAYAHRWRKPMRVTETLHWTGIP